jgi:hypothetical protein
MKKLLLLALSSCITVAAAAQAPKTALYDLVKKMLYDSTGYENVGDWAVGNPKKFPVKWKEDRVIMSEDTSINFYRSGTADIVINDHSYMQNGQPVKWNVMLKGPRMGYTSFSIISSPPSAEMKPGFTIDSIFGKKPFKARLLKSCDAKTVSGYYYYEVKIPKKDMAYIKVSWLSLNGNTAVRIDCYDSWSKYAVKLECPK